MLLLSLFLNVLVLVPVLAVLAANGKAAEYAWGPDTSARRILAAIYTAILLASLFLIAGQFLDYAISAWSQALLAVQIIYKLLTVPFVGLRNPVVLSNIGIAIVHAVTLVVTAG